MEQPFRLMDITALETAGTRGSLASQLDRMLHSSTSWDARVSKMIVDTGEYEVVLRGAIASDVPADATIASAPTDALIPGRL